MSMSDKKSNFTKTNVCLITLLFALGSILTGQLSKIYLGQKQVSFEVVPQPTKFVSPLNQIKLVREQTQKFEHQLKEPTDFASKEWQTYATWAQSWDELEFEQAELEKELNKTGAVELHPGRSYSFELETNCAPHSSTPGWVKIPDGYLMRITFNQCQALIEIYVPNEGA